MGSSPNAPLTLESDGYVHTHPPDPDGQALDGRVYTDASLFGSASAWPLTIINSVHLYHMVGGFALTGADYFHHGLFIPTLGLPGQLLRWGPLANWQAFFISGLPGGGVWTLPSHFETPPRRYHNLAPPPHSLAPTLDPSSRLPPARPRQTRPPPADDREAGERQPQHLAARAGHARPLPLSRPREEPFPNLLGTAL